MSAKFSKFLGIDVNERYKKQPADLDQRAKEALLPAQPYLEEEPTVVEWIKELKPTKAGVRTYIHEVLPSIRWVPRYNWRWAVADSIAGVTIGFVIVPQAMAYALLAQLSPEYGLYTSFTGAIVYWLFGTSKDIVIGTTAIGSLLVGSTVTAVREAKGDIYSAEEIARTLSLLAGCVLLFLGAFRLGWIIEFIPYIPISAFVTAASVTIMSTQVPVVLGLSKINTREAPYKVIINTLKALPDTKLDAAIGISSIVLLFILRDFCNHMESRQPHRKRLWAMLSSLRMTFVMVLYTLISYIINRGLPEHESRFRIVGTIEKGFSHAAVPKPTGELVGLIFPQLPAVVIILIIEHIAIAKSFGRIFNYTIVPSNEILSQGTANLFSPFVGGYVCTGSFGASAVLSKAGVKTPFAGLFSAFILILALYALTGVFYFIPKAALGGLIIHAVCNLLTPPKSLYKYWLLSPFELFIWFAGVFLAIFESLEVSIYITTALSAALLLVRLARTQGRFLGKVRVHRVPNDLSGPHSETESVFETEIEATSHDVFLPLDRRDGSNPSVDVETPYPGVFIYRFSEGFNYTNQGHHIASILSYITAHSRRTQSDDAKPSDRLWNDPGPRKSQESGDDPRPLLRSLVLDCSTINNMDITAVQGLIDLRNSLDRHAGPEPVEWHFASVHNRWTRRALAVAGFGYPAADKPAELENWRPVIAVAEMNDHSVERLRAHDEESGAETEVASAFTELDLKGGAATPASSGRTHTAHWAALHGIDRPFFHADLIEAVDAAVRGARRADQRFSQPRVDAALVGEGVHGEAPNASQTAKA